MLWYQSAGQEGRSLRRELRAPGKVLMCSGFQPVLVGLEIVQHLPEWRPEGGRSFTSTPQIILPLLKKPTRTLRFDFLIIVVYGPQQPVEVRGPGPSGASWGREGSGGQAPQQALWPAEPSQQPGTFKFPSCHEPGVLSLNVLGFNYLLFSFLLNWRRKKPP